MIAAVLAGGLLAGYSFGELAIWVVGIAAIVAVVIAVLSYYKVPIPGYVVHIFWIVVLAFIAITAIRLIMAM